MEKPAPTDKPIHDLIRRRWSPRAFSDRPVPREILATVFEAGRWAPSCYNEQPWRYLVATSDDAAGHARAKGVLSAGNAWAHAAPVLVLSLAKMSFKHNGAPNPHAWHDVGAASAYIFLQATSMGLYMHEMAGFDRERAREAYAIPAGWEPVAMIAIGYEGSAESLTEKQRAAEKSERRRNPLAEMVKGASFDAPFDM
jgi:nitroreductase